MNSYTFLVVALLCIGIAQAGVNRLSAGIQFLDPNCKLTEIGQVKQKPDGTLCLCSVAMLGCVNLNLTSPITATISIPAAAVNAAPARLGAGIQFFHPICKLTGIGRIKRKPDASIPLSLVAMPDCVDLSLDDDSAASSAQAP